MAFTTLYLIHSLHSIDWIWYNTSHIYTNPIYKITKLAMTQVNTNMKKLANMKILRFWRLTHWGFDTKNPLSLLGIINAFGECRILVHTNHFQVVLNSLCTGDSVDIVQLGKHWITWLPWSSSVNTVFTLYELKTR